MKLLQGTLIDKLYLFYTFICNSNSMPLKPILQAYTCIGVMEINVYK